jgi:hypothetical protein
MKKTLQNNIFPKYDDHCSPRNILRHQHITICIIHLGELRTGNRANGHGIVIFYYTVKEIGSGPTATDRVQ